MKSLSRVRLFATPWTVAYQAPPSRGFSRQDYWSGLPFPSPGDLPDPGIKLESPVSQMDSLLLNRFPGGSEVKASALQWGRPAFDPWIRKMPWRRKWQPAPVFLPVESHGWRSLVGYSPRGRKESNTTERLHTHLHTALLSFLFI